MCPYGSLYAPVGVSTWMPHGIAWLGLWRVVQAIVGAGTRVACGYALRTCPMASCRRVLWRAYGVPMASCKACPWHTSGVPISLPHGFLWRGPWDSPWRARPCRSEICVFHVYRIQAMAYLKDCL